MCMLSCFRWQHIYTIAVKQLADTTTLNALLWPDFPYYVISTWTVLTRTCYSVQRPPKNIGCPWRGGGPPWCLYPVHDSSMTERKVSKTLDLFTHACSDFTCSFHFLQDLPEPQCPFDSQSTAQFVSLFFHRSFYPDDLCSRFIPNIFIPTSNIVCSIAAFDCSLRISSLLTVFYEYLCLLL
jgi:hypothetical protein